MASVGRPDGEDSDESAAASERRLKVRRRFEERVSDAGRAPPPPPSAVTAVADVLLLPACRAAQKRAVVIGQLGQKLSKATPTLVGGTPVAGGT